MNKLLHFERLKNHKSLVITDLICKITYSKFITRK